MTFEEALAHVKKCATWETYKLMPQDRYVVIDATCYCEGFKHSFKYTFWEGVMAYRPEVVPILIEVMQRTLARHIVKKEETTSE